MSAPLVLEYLRDHSIADLYAAHGVKVAPARGAPYKASLNYDQLAARDDDPLACECRGLILATYDGSPIPTEGPVGELSVLARPMDRFFNFGQGAAHPVDDDALLHHETRVMEKVDGTLCIVYYDHLADLWCVATRSVPEADLPVDGFGDHTFRSLFQLAAQTHLGVDFDQLCLYFDPERTYCFELCSPRSGSGVVHNVDERLHLLAVRSIEGIEICPSAYEAHLPPVGLHAPRSLAELREFIESRSPKEAEGVVLRLPGRTSTGGFRRVKLKSSAYVAAHGLASEAGASPRNLLRVILAGQWDDVAPILRPHLRERGNAMLEAYIAWANRVDAAYDGLSVQAADRKAFALAVQAAKLPIGPMMSMWTRQAGSARTWVQSRAKNGEFGDGFLDSLAEMIGAAG